MSAGENLKCQFCELKFSSTYKIIPHTFFGHKKKISKMVVKHAEIRILCPCAPSGCPFVQIQAVSKTAGQEEIFRLLARSLIGMESHVNGQHTGEAQLTSCPYCALVLDNIIYWEHLQEHMASNNTSAESPAKATAVPPGDNAPKEEPAVAAVDLAAQAESVSVSSAPELVQNIEPGKQKSVCSFSEGAKGIIDVIFPGQVQSLDTDEKAIANPSLPAVGQTDLQPVVTPAPDTIPLTSEPHLSVKVNFSGEKQDSESTIAVANMPENREQSKLSGPAPLSVRLEHERQSFNSMHLTVKKFSKAEEDERANEEAGRALSPLPDIPKAPEELAADTIPFKDFFARQKSESLPLSPEKIFSPSTIRIDVRPSIPTEVKRTPKPTSPPVRFDYCMLPTTYEKIHTSEVSSLQGDPGASPLSQPSDQTPDAADQKQSPVILNKKVAHTAGVDQSSAQTIANSVKKKTLAQYSAERQGSSLNLPKPVTAATAAASSRLPLESEKARSEESHEERMDRLPSESEDKQPLAEEKIPRLSPVPSEVTFTSPQEQKSPESVPMQLRPSAEADVRKKDRFQSGSSTVSGDGKRSPLVISELPQEQPAFIPEMRERERRPSSSASSSSSRSEHERRSSGDQRQSSDQRRPLSRQDIALRPSGDTRRPHPSGIGERRRHTDADFLPKPPPKPVLTQELENQIISGGDVFMKKKKRERIGRQQEERDREKMTREEKLAQVKREIEERFQEEEARRLREKEEQRKREAQEQERKRKEEDRIKREKEKFLAEKKKKQQNKDSLEKETAKKEKIKSEKEKEQEEKEQKEQLQEEKKTLETTKVEEGEITGVSTAESEREPDQYERIAQYVLSKQKETQALMDSRAESECDTPVKASPTRLENKSSQEEMEVEEDDEDDDLEAMMRKYREKEEMEMLKAKEQQIEMQERPTGGSLAFLMDSYSSETRKRERSGSGSPPTKYSKIEDNSPLSRSPEPEEPPVKVIPKGFDELGRPLDEGKKPFVSEEQLLEDSMADESERMIPQGFDAEGHPLDESKISVGQLTADEEAARRLAASTAAMDIMAPAKRSKELKAASQLLCSLCKEEGGTGTYYSAYQLLAHIFLSHRKKIISRSRKVRGMTLACPEGCGYVTPLSQDNVSIDYFNNELPVHLDMLCEHIRDCHTGEPKMESCQFCSLPLQHDENWSWQHLSNHRDARRFFCDGCNNFPFKTEVHKCPGTGLETSYTAEEARPAPPALTKELPDVSKTKSLEELAREVEAGKIDPEQLVNRKNLGNLERFICLVCDRYWPRLSAWLQHVRLEHVGRGHVTNQTSLKCFCCHWVPARFERGREIIGVNNLLQHLVTEHHSNSWQDEGFQQESAKFTQIQRDMERRLEREREEAGLQLPRLPAPCPTCKIVLHNAKLYRYHFLAHRFGEVYCATCHTCILGHHYQEHSATCREEDKLRVRANVERFRGDTWLDVAGKKFKVAFSYDDSEELGSITVAKCIINGRSILVGSGSSHEEATRFLREEVEDFFTTLKKEEELANKEEDEKEDKQKLVDLFAELASVDRASTGLVYLLEVEGEEKEVITKFYFTKNGKCMISAAIDWHGEVVYELGRSRQEAVEKLANHLNNLLLPPTMHKEKMTVEEEKDAEDVWDEGEEEAVRDLDAKFCCVDCGSKFRKHFLYELHRKAATCA